MADVERITPPVPILPPPIGRGVGSRRRPVPQRDREPQPEPTDSDKQDSDHPPEHINEYV
jgi:hypothetical protein